MLKMIRKYSTNPNSCMTSKKINLIRIFFILLICLLPSQSFSQNISLLTFHELSSDGIKDGCSLNFQVVGRDEVYKKGKKIISWGSFTFINRDKMTNHLFKIGVSDLPSINAMKSIDVPNIKSDNINYAYFKTKSCYLLQSELDTISKFAKKKNIDCKLSSGQEVSTFYGEKNELILIYDWVNPVFQNISSSLDYIEVGFNRKKGAMDVKLILDLKTKENFEEVRKYSKCSSEVTKDYLEKLSKSLEK